MHAVDVQHLHNQISKIGTTSVRNDSGGDLLNDNSNSYTWDAEQRVISVAGRWTGVYNALGQRVQKQSAIEGSPRMGGQVPPHT